MTRKETTIKIKDETWEDLTKIKLEFRCRSLNDAIILLIDNFYDEPGKTPQNALKHELNTLQQEGEGIK